MDTEIQQSDTVLQSKHVTISPSVSGRRGGQSKRLRVSRACDRCKKRKIRCTGTRPCEICIRDDASCIYNAPYNRGRRSHASTSHAASELRNDGQRSPEFSYPQMPPDSDSQQERLTPSTDRLDPVDTTTRLTSSKVSPEPITDLQGHYVGPASGVSFLARVRKRLHYDDHTATMFTFGDAPLPEHDPTPSVMLPAKEAWRLLERFFDFTVPIDRMIPRPIAEQWLQEFLDTMGDMREPESAPARRAILWMMFAMAQEHMPEETGSPSIDKSLRYFLAADYQLCKERGTISLASIQARLYQCFWLLARSRMNHCWGLFGTAARLALALGLHRKRSSRPDSSFLPIDLDCRQRAFWSAYCLDTHLSLTLGRPRIFHDEDIDQDLPSGVEDSVLISNGLTATNGLGYSTMLAPVAYYKLHLILSRVLRDLYSIRPLSTSEQYTLARKYSQQLKEWRKNSPDFLQVENKAAPPLITIFQRQRDVLNFTYWHAVVVTNRPMLLKNFTRVQGDTGGAMGGSHHARIVDGVSECVQAALSIADRVFQMFESGGMFRSFWGTCYYGFSAAVVLYVYTIQQATSPVEFYEQYLEAATRIQNKMSAFTENGSLVTRYCLVLEELRLEALRHIEGYVSPAVIDLENPTTSGDNMANMVSEYANILGAPMPHLETARGEAVNAPADLVTWMQFESLFMPNFAGFDPMRTGL
ncbi:fungal-specific transcription factor domain-containing protein [Xylariales sp. PMI_506]|nr:fungal-specific transcription factor domain-containing protein [Xylariales sp. PMI_506]